MIGDSRGRAPLCIVVGLMGVLVALAPTGDPDIFWHLRVGQVALSRHTTLPVDLFSSLFAGQPWPYKDLIGDVLLYVGFAALGFAGFALLKLVAVAAIALGCHLAARPGERRQLAVVVALGLLVGSLRLVERPNLFSLMLYPAMLVLVERVLMRASQSSHSRVPTEPGASARRGQPAWAAQLAAFAPLVGLQWVWANLHRAAILGLFVIGALALRLSLSWWASRFLPTRWSANRLTILLGEVPRTETVVAAWIALPLALAASLLNPSGRALFGSGVFVAHSAMLRQTISEWQPLPWSEFLRSFPAGAVLVALAVLGLLMQTIHALRRGETDTSIVSPSVPLWHLGWIALFFFLLPDSVRWLPYLLLSSAFVLARLGGELLTRWSSRGLAPRGLFTLGAVAMLAVVFHHRQGAGPYALGLAQDRYPVGAVRFAREHHLDGAVVNPISFGGYLLWEAWPGTRVLVDGRNDLVYPPDFVMRCLDAEHDAAQFTAMRAQDGATWVLAQNSSRDPRPKAWSRDPEWMLVYWSEAALVYARREQHPELASLRFELIQPEALDVSVIRALDETPARTPQLEAELKRMLAASPDSVRANSAAFLYYHLRGAPYRPQRDQILEHLLEVGGDLPVVRELLRRAGVPRQ